MLRRSHGDCAHGSCMPAILGLLISGLSALQRGGFYFVRCCSRLPGWGGKKKGFIPRQLQMESSVSAFSIITRESPDERGPEDFQRTSKGTTNEILTQNKTEKPLVCWYSGFTVTKQEKKAGAHYLIGLPEHSMGAPYEHWLLSHASYLRSLQRTVCRGADRLLCFAPCASSRL